MGRFQRVVCVSQATPRVRSGDLCAQSLPLCPLHYHGLYGIWPMDGTKADRTASCLFLLLGPASGRMGHMFWQQTGVPDVPAASQLTLTPLGLPLGSVFLQATRGRGLEDHQMGRMERSLSTGKSIAQKNATFFSCYTTRSNFPDRPVSVARPTTRTVSTACAACAGCVALGHSAPHHEQAFPLPRDRSQ